MLCDWIELFTLHADGDRPEGDHGARLKVRMSSSPFLEIHVSWILADDVRQILVVLVADMYSISSSPC